MVKSVTFDNNVVRILQVFKQIVVLIEKNDTFKSHKWHKYVYSDLFVFQNKIDDYEHLFKQNNDAQSKTKHCIVH